MLIIKKLINLYNHSVPINQLNCNTVDYSIFKSNSLIRFCDIKSNIKYTPVGLNKRVDAFNGFAYDNPYFWMIPLTTTKSDEIFGFVLKSYHQKAYRNIFCDENICSFYGFHNFHNFKKGYPIILTEGTKDCITISKIYPYTLACLTAGLGQDDLKCITNLTNKVILCYDNDEPGKKATNRDKEAIIKCGCMVNTIFYRGKDPAENCNNIVGLEIIKNSIKSSLQSFAHH